MPYRITKQYTRGSEQRLSQTFQNEGDAKTFITTKIANDISLNVKVIYRLYDGDDLVGKFDSSETQIAADQSNQGEGAQGKGRTSSFNPTPFNTSPRPANAPRGWVKDEDEEEKKK